MEKLFGRFWKNNPSRLKKQTGYILLSDFEEELKLWTQLCLEDSLPGLNLGFSQWAMGFWGETLLLPKELAWTRDPELNLELVRLLILKAAASLHLPKFPPFYDRSRTFPRLQLLSQMYRLNLYLDKRFQNFAEKEKALYQRLLSLRPDLTKDPHFKNWSQLISAREVTNFEIHPKWQKSNDTPSELIYSTVPLPFRSLTLETNDSQRSAAKEKKPAPQKTFSRKQKEFTESVELSKQGATNPVTHSFEKLETADDYQGGRKPESDKDELEDHSNALDELEMNRHTSEGETSSVYSQDIETIFKNSSTLTNAPNTQEKFQYNEWSYSLASYLINYCTVLTREIEESQPLTQEATYLSQNQQVIHQSRGELDRILNRPLWRKPLIEGSEVDIDAYIRFRTSPAHSLPQIYAEKAKSARQISMGFLIDSSYSTDTWIDGVRVIDLIKECMTLTGPIFQDLIDSVAIYLTNSETRNKIYFSTLKNFTEDWERLRYHLYAVEPHQYTRLGPAIRHATELMRKTESGKLILFLITDGKPTDLDPYEGQHGQLDVQKAIFEAEKVGVHVVALTISDTDPAFLKKMFRWPKAIRCTKDFYLELINEVKRIFSHNKH